ncbi:kinesin family member 14 [Camelus ferus]|nr:kinesin family member 14 [Camelus ferus]
MSVHTACDRSAGGDLGLPAAPGRPALSIVARSRQLQPESETSAPEDGAALLRPVGKAGGIDSTYVIYACEKPEGDPLPPHPAGRLTLQRRVTRSKDSSLLGGERGGVAEKTAEPRLMPQRCTEADAVEKQETTEKTDPLKVENSQVTVAVRVRPFSSRETTERSPQVVFMNGDEVAVEHPGLRQVYSFVYDLAFWSVDKRHPGFASQTAVYAALAAPLLQQAFQGYNTCLFAYGQTGSGKSYTEKGHLKSHFIRRCPALIAAVSAPQLRVREHPTSGPYVEGLSTNVVSSYSDVQVWLELGNKKKATAATGMNDKSSRSHSVLTLVMTQTKTEFVEGEELDHRVRSRVNLVDLAGSERCPMTQTSGERLKEGVSINKSLLTLGKVISALSERAHGKRVFIPYRESVLTWQVALKHEGLYGIQLLKESLSGNSKTAMVATVSPAASSVEETLGALRYATQARAIVNVARVNEDKAGITFQMDNHLPNLVNLNEDPQLSEILLYMLKEGTTTVGKRRPSSSHDIQLAGVLIAEDHCTISNVDGTVSITPVGEAKTYINGKLILEPTVLHHALEDHRIRHAKILEALEAEKQRIAKEVQILQQNQSSRDRPLTIQPNWGSMKLSLMIQEANAVSKKLEKNYVFGRHVVPDKGGGSDTCVQVRNLQLGVSTVWSLEKFESKLAAMKELYEEQESDEEQKGFQLSARHRGLLSPGRPSVTLIRELIGSSLELLGQSYGEENTVADSLVSNLLRICEGILAVSKAHEEQDEDSQCDVFSSGAIQLLTVQVASAFEQLVVLTRLWLRGELPGGSAAALPDELRQEGCSSDISSVVKEAQKQVTQAVLRAVKRVGQLAALRGTELHPPENSDRRAAGGQDPVLAAEVSPLPPGRATALRGHHTLKDAKGQSGLPEGVCPKFSEQDPVLAAEVSPLPPGRSTALRGHHTLKDAKGQSGLPEGVCPKFSEQVLNEFPPQSNQAFLSLLSGVFLLIRNCTAEPPRPTAFKPIRSLLSVWTPSWGFCWTLHKRVWSPKQAREENVLPGAKPKTRKPYASRSTKNHVAAGSLLFPCCAPPWNTTSQHAAEENAVRC